VVSAGKPWGKEVLQMMLSYPDELIKKGSGNLIGLSHFGHFAIDTYPSPFRLCNGK
jgi:hypothetical protein